MRSARILKTAAAVVIPILWSNSVRPSLPLDHRGRTAANAAVATAYACLFGGRPNWTAPRGLRHGLVAASVVAAGYAAALTIPPLRAAMTEFADRGDTGAVEWVTIHIPIGTVYSEELIFRATLTPLLDATLGPGAARLTSALTFGLCHVAPARTANDNIAATIATTTLAGLLFDRLARNARSVTAPALFHFALNAGGVLAPRAAARARVMTP
ncbi:CPBP family intramembrane glutamic endopeptidase [Nocardia bovistercoris]|uniref:CPBP family intramembrane metalloprotease n=1 Tax=Nocardia bovistercoris TaxID=2785916 RepID=A0A931N661_9NOCA|nr:CPBP family intramembrane glutamic endopeptidase [Nocardia bovistercoris]MBH0780619.1 CPBP family intramembrane metalloprotease [Nocardia bovistercoris]